MLAANLMNVAGTTEKLINLSRALVGWLPGGLGRVSMLFAGISGSNTAEAAGVGGVLIPAMKEQGYDTSFAVSLVACAAVMGVIIPPSILMVVWGGVISVSIGGLFLAGVLMSVAFMIVVYVYARRRNYPVFPRPTRRELASVVWHAILPILTPGIIVGGIVFGFFTPTEASVVAVLYAMFLGVFIYRRVGFKHLRETL
jgi:tripartite ATP-independent transporter DctM subunit